MRWSEILIPTLKETPAEAEAISHILMIRAGLIRKLTSGVYSYLPAGFKVLKKIERIIAEEMDKKGAQQVLLPAIQPVELWNQSGRFEALGEDMITFSDRHKKLNVLGPTHEEVITALVKNEVNSYRQLPLIIYQIQTKFRDEARPRFGVIRSREFIMKDAYSFDRDMAGLNQSYEKMYDAYCRIFERCGLRFLAVEADTGVMGGDVSHEFMVLAENGEDRIAHCQKCAYAASLDKAECTRQVESEKLKVESEKLKALEEVKTPGKSSVKDVAEFLKVNPENLIKTLIYVADSAPIAVLLRGDHEINETKLSRYLKVKSLAMADEAMIKKVTQGPMGFSGPCGLKDIRIIADHGINGLIDGVVGANKPDAHFINVNLNRDFQVSAWADIRNITGADLCPRCKSAIKIESAIEIGHVFKLGTKYSKSLGATYLDEQGNAQEMIMGCYGIGVTRIIAACIEQNFDDNGIIWPKTIAPFSVIVMPLNPQDQACSEAAQTIFRELEKAGVEGLLDDRNIRAGIKFKDADLLGVPLQLIVGEKNLAHGQVEIKTRKNNERFNVPVNQAADKVQEILAAL